MLPVQIGPTTNKFLDRTAADADTASDDMTDSNSRSTEEVLEDHLAKRRKRLLEDDLATNYADSVALLTVNSNAVGHDAIRYSAARLAEQLPEADYEFIAKQVNGPYALLIWRATSRDGDAIDGADSFVIEDGLIQLQTIHYRLVNSESRCARPDLRL